MLKSNIAWMKKNVPSDLKVWKGMIQDIDWSQVAAKTKLSLQRDKDRITAEFKEFAAMDTSAKIDWLMNGDRHLGYLYKKDAIAFARREWKGLKSVGYDFVGWLKIWGGMLNMVMKDPMSIMLAVFEYHWFASYLATPAVVDRSVFGRRGKLLQADFDMWVAITHWAEDLIANLIMADAKIGGNQKINKRIIMFDEMTMAQMMAGFPNLLGIPYQMIPVFMVSEMDQLTLIPYIDAIESYGLPSDTCPLPTAECGCAVKDEYPMCGQGFIASSMPCDGSVMATSFQDRRFSKFMPSYPLCMPVRYDDEDTTEMAAADMKDCIHWVEGLTGETWNWDTYFATMEKMNECTRLEMEKWEINKTAYPQLIGPTYELFRKWCYEMDGGLDPRTIKSCEKVNKILLKGYKNKEQAWRNKMRYRAITWSCPPHYYANFSNWLANSWGINVVVEMESLNYTKHLNTTDETEALRDMARLYERMVMRRHTNGGYHNVVTELWRQCEAWNTNIVIMWQHVACKNMATVQGLLDEQGRELGLHLIWIPHDLMDPRTVSRRTMRDTVSSYMDTVMHATPVDETLLDFADDVCM